MRINSYKKKANGQYEVSIGEKKISLHEDLILKHDLLLKKEIEESFLETLQEENKKYYIYDEALKYLKTKMRSKKEMYSYLESKEYKREDCKKVIEKLEKEKYIDDVSYIRAFIHDRIHLSSDGPLKIKKDLEKKVNLKEEIEASLKIYTNELERERIEKLIKKAIKTNRNKSKKILRQKVYNDLSILGYNTTPINNKLYLLEDVEEEDLKKKEYEKLYGKLSKKYSGRELENKIKQKMYQKGFY